MTNLWDAMFQGGQAQPVRGVQPGTAPQPFQPGIKIGDDRYRAQIAMFREWQLDNPERASEFDFSRWQREVLAKPVAAAPTGTPGPATPPSMTQPYAPQSERPPAHMDPAAPPDDGLPPGVSFRPEVRYR